DGDTRAIATDASWHRVGGSDAEVHVPSLSLIATNDTGAVQRGRDGTVLASATSVLASQRELEAAEAFAHGDQDRARSLVQQNIAALATAQALAPAPAASALQKQQAEYGAQLKDFAASPSSDDGKRAA